MSELPCASVSKHVLMQNLSSENVLDCKHKSEPVAGLVGAHFHMD